MPRKRKPQHGTAAKPSNILAAAVLAPMAPPPQALNPVPASPPPLQPDLGDAVRFVMTVKREFAAGEPDKYEEFLAVLVELQSMGTDAVVDRVKVLLGERHDLICGFNKFLMSTQIRAAL